MAKGKRKVPEAPAGSWPLGTIVEVEWLDSCRGTGWGSMEDHAKDRMAVCRSVGYLLEQTKEKVKVVQSISQHTSHIADTITIPAVAVKTIRTIK